MKQESFLTKKSIVALLAIICCFLYPKNLL